MRVSHFLLLAVTSFVAATPSGLNYHPRRTDGGDDGAPTCQEAVQQVPKCALSCIVQPPIDAGCKSVADFACTCEKKTRKAITKAETPCVLKACGLKQALAASRAGKTICDVCNVTPEEPSDPNDGYHHHYGNENDGYDQESSDNGENDFS